MTGVDRLASLTAAQLKVLRDRAREAAPAPAAEDQADELEVLELQSHGQSFALNLRSIEGIVDLVSLAAVPRRPPIVRGLVAFRGEVLVGIELGALFGQGAIGVADLRRIVVINSKGVKIAVLTEKTLSVGKVHHKSFHASATGGLPFVIGTNERFVSLLDAEALVSFVVGALGQGPVT